MKTFDLTFSAEANSFVSPLLLTWNDWINAIFISPNTLTGGADFEGFINVFGEEPKKIEMLASNGSNFVAMAVIPIGFQVFFVLGSLSTSDTKTHPLAMVMVIDFGYIVVERTLFSETPDD